MNLKKDKKKNAERADLRGYDLSNTEFIDFSFKGKIVGLTVKRKILLFAISILLSLFTGLVADLAAGICYIAAQRINHQIVVVLMIAISLVFLSVFTSKKYGFYSLLILLIIFIAVIGSAVGSLLGAVIGSLTVAMIIIVLLIGAATGAGIYAILNKWSVVLAAIGSIVGSIMLHKQYNDIQASFLALLLSIILEVVSGEIASKILADNQGEISPLFYFLRSRAIAFSAWGGTSFERSTFINCDFSEIQLNHTNFKNAVFFRTNFRKVKGDFNSRFDGTILDDFIVKALCFGNEKKEENYAGLNLNGAYLREADLRCALLSKAQALGTDFTGADFSEACIQDWNINSETILDDIICNRVYVTHTISGSKIKFIQHKPDSGEFTPGQFSQWIKNIRDVTVDLILAKDTNWKAIAPSILRSGMNNPGSLISIASIENKKDYVVIKLEVSPSSDKELLHQDLMLAIDEFSTAIKNNDRIQIEVSDENKLSAFLITRNDFPLVKSYEKYIEISSDNENVMKSLKATEIFFSYAHEDEALRNELAKHLKLLERHEVIKTWHDRQITAGDEWKNEIDTHLETADIILLLISADFLASDYCYDIELKRALERHKNREARVIPIILRSVDWHNASFGKLTALPTDGRPITDWPNQDQAFTDVVKGIRNAIEQIKNPSQGQATKEVNTTPNSGDNQSEMNQNNRDQSTGFQINVSGGTVNINPPNQPPLNN
jgi:uncharacterized protein YjbI with pentapeptide repeats